MHSKVQKALMLVHERFGGKNITVWSSTPNFRGIQIIEYISMYSLSGKERSCDYTAEFSFQIHADAMLENQSMCVLKTLIQLLKTKAVA